MEMARSIQTEFSLWYQALPNWARCVVWIAVFVLAGFLALQILLHVFVGAANYERMVEVRTRHYTAKLTVFNPGAFSSYDTIIEVQPRASFSRPCQAFHLARSGPRIADVHWEIGSDRLNGKRELVVTIPESAEVTPLDQCNDVTFTFVRVPSAEKED